MRGFGDVAERLRRATVQVRVGGHTQGRGQGRAQGSGSGVVWGREGVIVTNAHVVRSRDPQVELWDGRSFRARIASRDVRRDLAVLRIEADSLEAAPAGDSDAVRPGEIVIAVGNPLGFAGAISTGTVHSSGGGWIRAGVQLAPGNSGGPLANARGEVIGINTAIVNGLGLAVPSNTVADFLRNGARPSLGVVLRPVHLGLLLLEVEPDGAADLASLRAGDTLLTRFDDLNAALDGGRDVLRLHFLRGDGKQVREAVVRLGARVEAAA
jgi:serine protease Do